MRRRLVDRTKALLKKAALVLSSWLRSIARVLAEWAGMHKRIEIVVRNPGYEGTESAMGALSLDFEDEQTFHAAEGVLMNELSFRKGTGQRHALILRNERDEVLGFDPGYFVSFRISNADEWRPTWLLPANGSPPLPES